MFEILFCSAATHTPYLLQYRSVYRYMYLSIHTYSHVQPEHGYTRAAKPEPTSASSGQFSLQPAHAASQQEPREKVRPCDSGASSAKNSTPSAQLEVPNTCGAFFIPIQGWFRPALHTPLANSESAVEHLLKRDKHRPAS